MKTIILMIGTLILLTLNACQSDNRENTKDSEQQVNTQQETPVKLIEYLVGEWKMESSTGGQDNQQGSPGETITFTHEARYAVHEGYQLVDSGAYRMNEQLQNLYLESAGNETPREYDLDLESGNMTLKSRDGKVQYVYRRVSRPNIPPDKGGDAQSETQ